MDVDEIWRHIDQQREELAALFGTFSADDWETQSLCAGWRVRDVAAHLTLAQTGPVSALIGLARARGSFNGMIRDTAVRQAGLPVEEYAPRLRAMVGSRRRVPTVAHLDPLMDVLVHGQDMTRPLGRPWAAPLDAAVATTQRAWSMGFPFRAQRRLGPVRLVATDADWTAGQGAEVEAPIEDLLLLVTGRDVVLPSLAGPGAELLRGRVSR